MVVNGDPEDWVAVVLLPVADALVVQLGVHILVVICIKIDFVAIVCRVVR